MGELSFTYEVTETREEHRSLMVRREGKELFLHSRIFPSREAGSLSDHLVPGKYDVLIVLGTGLAYHLAPLKESIPGFRLVLCIDILTGLEEHIAADDLTAFLVTAPNVRFLLGKSEDELKDSMTSLLEFSEIQGINVVEHPASLRIFGEYYNGVRALIQSVINRKAGSAATRKAFGSLFTRNIIRMLAHTARFSPVASLFGRFSGMAALIVTPGPSLEGVLAALKGHENKFIIIAVDSALAVLRERGFSPDICVSIDPQPYIAEHLQGREDRGLSVFSLSSNPVALRHAPEKGVFVSLNSHPLCQVLDELYTGVVGSIDSGTGSVAGDALCLAVRLGFPVIGMAGFDFSFIKHEIYARGTAYQRRYSMYFQNRLTPVEKANLEYIMKSSRGYRHEGTLSRKAFVHYRDRLEDFIPGLDKGGIFRLNASSVPLRGTIPAGPDAFIEAIAGEIEKGPLLESAALSPSLDGLISMEALASLVRREDVYGEIMINALGGERDERRERRILALIDSLWPG